VCHGIRHGVEREGSPKAQHIRLLLQSCKTSRHPNVRIHYTPTNSTRLNQIEIWFSKIQRDLIARGIFTSLNDLDRKIMRYIRLYNRNAAPSKISTKML